MGHKAEVSTGAQAEKDHPPRRSVFTSILAKFRRAEARLTPALCALLKSPWLYELALPAASPHMCHEM